MFYNVFSVLLVLVSKLVRVIESMFYGMFLGQTSEGYREYVLSYVLCAIVVLVHRLNGEGYREHVLQHVLELEVPQISLTCLINLENVFNIGNRCTMISMFRIIKHFFEKGINMASFRSSDITPTGRDRLIIKVMTGKCTPKHGLMIQLWIGSRRQDSVTDSLISSH